MAAGTGMATTLALTTTTSFTPKIISVRQSGESIEDVPTSHLSTTGTMTYSPADLKEGGEVQIECQFDPALAIPLGTVDTFTINWGGQGTGKKSACSGYVKSIDKEAQMGPNLMSATITIKVAGAWTHQGS